MVWGKNLVMAVLCMSFFVQLKPISDTSARVGAVLVGFAGAAGAHEWNRLSENGPIVTASWTVFAGLATWLIADAYLSTFTLQGSLIEAGRLIASIEEEQLMMQEFSTEADFKTFVEVFYYSEPQPFIKINKQVNEWLAMLHITNNVIEDIMYVTRDQQALTTCQTLNKKILELQLKIERVEMFLEHINGEQCH